MKEVFLTLQQYLESLQSRGKYTFLRLEAIAALHLTENAFKKAAHRLIKKGKVKRIRGNFYIIVPPEHQALGSLPASWFIDDLMAYLNLPYYCGLLTAASLLGSAHQQPMIFQVITTKSIRPIKLNNLQIDFYYKKFIEPHFYNTVKTSTGNMKASTPEMTSFDLVRYMEASGHINNIGTILCELFSKLSPEKLANLTEAGEVEVTAAQRLGYLLDILKLPIDLLPLEIALKSRKPLKRLLIPGVKQTVLEKNRRWKILVNEILEPDEL
jgi:predicted transcriptional regulator of viral defense system